MARRTRDRHGRGMRGPAVAGGRRSRREEFDLSLLGAVQRLERRWGDELGLVEFAVEETPSVGPGWDPASVPLASLVRGSGTTPTRVVLFRKPIELRCELRSELHALVRTVLVEQVSELLGREPEEIDPRYDGQ